MPKDVTAPEVLSGHAVEIWKSAFLSSYSDTCKDRSDKDACAAAIAWTAVKNVYKKNEAGEWVQKATVDAPDVNAEEQYPAPLGQSGVMPTPARLMGDPRAIWEAAFEDALRVKCTEASNPKNCAEQEAWRAVNEKYHSKDGENWVQRNTLERLVGRHYGPGTHASGTEQSIHGTGIVAGGGGYTDIDAAIKEAERELRKAGKAGDEEAIIVAERKQSGLQEAKAAAKKLGGGKFFQVVDNAFNRQFFSGVVGQIFKSPPSYANVRPYRMPEDVLEEFEMMSEAGHMDEITPTAFQRRKFFSRQRRKEMAGKGKALPWGGFPIDDCGDVKNAVRAIGRAKDRSRTIAHIKRHAKSLGCSHLIPKKWSGSGAKEKSIAAEEESTKMNDEQIALAARSVGIDVNALRNRRAVRAKEAAEDQALLDAGYSEHPARRPDGISSSNWAKLPMVERTVGAVVWNRHVLRTYAEAVENAVLQGWKAEKNPHRNEEWIFKSWIETPDGWQLVRGILVRQHDSDEWYIKEVSRGASLSLAIRCAPDEVRR